MAAAGRHDGVADVLARSVGHVVAVERIAADAPAVDREVLGVWASEATTASIRAQVERMSAGRPKEEQR